MSLNEIQLQGKMLADLYGDVLVSGTSVSLKQAQVSLPQDQDGSIRFLGKNKKNYCFIVSYPEDPFLPDDQMEVLIKIMQACRLSMDDIALLNIARINRNIDDIRAQLEPSKMVLLGVNPSDIRLPIQFPAYKPQSYAACSFLYSESLDAMDNTDAGKQIKGKLWTALKEMFGL